MQHYEYILDITNPNKGIILDYFQEITPTQELAQNLNMPYYMFCHFSNYVIVNGYKYFFKQPTDTRYLLSELLGVQLSKYMGLKTIEHKVLTNGENVIGLLSKNFREPNKSYVESYHLSKEELKYIRNVLTSSYYDKTPFKNELARYLMRNFYASETDANVLCERTKDWFSLTLYDYEDSFRDSNLETYKNDDLFKGKSIPIDTIYLSHLMSSPDMYSSLKRVLSFNIELALQTIEDEQGIQIPEILKYMIINFDEERKNFMLEKIKF